MLVLIGRGGEVTEVVVTVANTEHNAIIIAPLLQVPFGSKPGVFTVQALLGSFR